MSKRWRLTGPARNDLDDVYLYTAKQWGFDHADHYLDDLLDVLERTLDLPALWRDRSEFYPGLYSVQSGRHHLFFFVSDTVVEVIRVLHERRDLWRHLPARR